MKAFKFKLLPNNTQKDLLCQIGGANRFVWNHMLDLNKTTYKQNKKFVFRIDMINNITQLKKDNTFLKDVPSQTLQQKCMDLDKAIRNVYKLGLGFLNLKVKNTTQIAFVYLKRMDISNQPKHK